MKFSETDIVGKIVAEDHRAASVFGNHSIDFCCNGNRTVADACIEKDLDPGMVLCELNKILEEPEKEKTYFNSWPLDLLADYIEKKHHRYVETKIGEIRPYLEKIIFVHGDKHPELSEINDIFNNSAGELAMHMKKEELVLFPYIRKMVKAKENHEELAPVHFGTIQNPVAMMMLDHDGEGKSFRAIRALSNDYTAPEDACNTYRVTFSLLNEFEEDLHQHIHLENNILFPKAIELENELI